MSWRLLIFSLLIFAAIATTIGLKAGDWLIDHVPDQANIPNTAILDPEPQVDAQGRPVMNQPQQPLLNGSQGVPPEHQAVNWKIDSNSVKQSEKNAETGEKNNSANNAGAYTVTEGDTGASANYRPLQRNNTTATSSAGAAWQGEFQQKMAACRRLDFNSRPSCIRNTRQQYCGANNAWGQINDCPAQ
ncbi:hypothetical protein [Brackiella oedipodis]|uniref:hypothetical protein n=1 Tax=Brackiella oedipodis TaxID=124225 RepID=UPI00048A565A|nr:hypothetical protein [Brackiella oedipodis]